MAQFTKKLPYHRSSVTEPHMKKLNLCVFQFIVGEDGTYGFTMLHAIIDGTPCMALSDYITSSM